MINSRQEIHQYSDAQQAISFNNDIGLESYMVILEDLRNIIAHLNESAIQFGVVAPESTVAANNSQLYFDTNTSTMYTNPTIGAVTGWVAI